MDQSFGSRRYPCRCCGSSEESRSLSSSAIQRPTDAETRKFISYWFATQQEDELARLTTVLGRHDGPTKQALMIALSRIIVSKEMMASLARDTSHSRRIGCRGESFRCLWRVPTVRSASRPARLLPDLIVGNANIRLGDARTLDGIPDEGFDLVLKSPPYLNAIDYIRGHRLALVWMGHAMASRDTRVPRTSGQREFYRRRRCRWSFHPIWSRPRARPSVPAIWDGFGDTRQTWRPC